MRRFLALVEQHAREAYLVSEAANQIGLSVRQVARLILGSLRYPPGIIIDLARVSSVAREIIEGRMTLKSTALGHDFPDQATMTRLFARFTGLTPGEYRSGQQAPATSETA